MSTRLRYTWGPWRFNPLVGCLEIPVNENYSYEIAVVSVPFSAQEAERWREQITDKSWATATTLEHLAEALSEIRTHAPACARVHRKALKECQERGLDEECQEHDEDEEL